MKRVIFLSFVILLMGSLLSSGQTTKNETKSSSSNDKVEAYYFHFTARCETCRTVESEAKDIIKSLYNGAVTFKAVNLDDDSSKALAEKLQVSGQTLLLVKGNTKVNITNEGFLYAVTNPDKLQSVIKEKVDGLLDM